MPSRDDGMLSWFWRRQLSALSQRGAVLAGLMLLQNACGDDVIVAHDPVAPRSDAGVSPLPDPADAATGSPEGLPPGIAQLPDVASGGSPESDVLALSVLERLEDLCGLCHSDGDDGAGFSAGLELTALIETGMIVPGSSATSPLLMRITDGSMPPDISPGRPRGAPTVGDIALLADFIDQLATEPAPSCNPLPFVGSDAALAAVLADVQGQPAEERSNLRYVSLTGASNARLCGAALDQQRQALFKLVNGMSMQSEIHLPTAIDPDGLLYRLDLRDYGWAREIDVDGDGVIDFADGWAAALGAVPDAVAFTGPEASALASETGSDLSLSSLGAFVRVASNGEVYRALLGVPANVYDMELLLGLDAIAALVNNEVLRAGFTRYPPQSEVLVARFRLGDGDPASYWVLAMEDSGQARSETIFSDPLGFYDGQWTKTLWELPNGLSAYLLNGPDGTPLADIPRGCDGTCIRPILPQPVACMGCHARGLRPVEDLIRTYVVDNELFFDRESVEDILATYPTAAELDQVIAGDDARFRAALERAGVSPDAPDPVSRVYLDHDRSLDLERAAAELGVPAPTLSDHLGALPALAPLATPSGTVERAVFSEAYVAASCAVHATSRNRPASCP